MGARSGLLLIVASLIAALATLNWGLLVTPGSMSIGFMHLTAPLGLIMLGLTALMGVVFITYLMHLQGAALLETRRHAKDIRAQRELADKAEASRFMELRSFLEGQQRSQLARIGEQQVALQTCVEQLGSVIKSRADQSDALLTTHTERLKDVVFSRQ